jgi:hypothetical protein
MNLDLVYPLKRGGSRTHPLADEELRYSLRAMSNLRLEGFDAARLVLLGYLPPWLRSGEGHPIRHIPMDDKGDKAENLVAKYKRMVDDGEISDPFLLLDDDHVFLKPTTAIPLHTKGELKTLCDEYRGSTHGKYLKNCHDLLTKAGLPTKNYQLHFPLLIHKDILRTVLAMIDRPTVMGSLYGNLIDGETVEVTRDFKLNKPHDYEALKDGPFVSLADGQMRVAMVRKWLAKLLPEKSKWER